jgi:ABC-type multidrug transport system fused ATPase/permease subunit
VGPSGAGKTTISDLLMGLIAPDQGRVLIDGSDWSPSGRGMAKQIGYVPQTPLFHDHCGRTSSGQPEATEEEMNRALELAAAGEFVSGSGKVDTVLGDRRVLVSGGGGVWQGFAQTHPAHSRRSHSSLDSEKMKTYRTPSRHFMGG